MEIEMKLTNVKSGEIDFSGELILSQNSAPVIDAGGNDVTLSNINMAVKVHHSFKARIRASIIALKFIWSPAVYAKVDEEVAADSTANPSI